MPPTNSPSDRAVDPSPDQPPVAPNADLRWLWRYIRQRGRAGFLAIFSGVIAGITLSASPYLIGVIIDQIRHQIDLAAIGAQVLLLIVLTVISIAAFFGQALFQRNSRLQGQLRCPARSVRQFADTRSELYQRYTTGDLISRMYTDMDNIWRLLLIGFTRSGSAVLTILTAFVLLARINVPLTLLVFLVLGISTTIQMRVGVILAPIFEARTGTGRDAGGACAGRHQRDQTIKTFGARIRGRPPVSCGEQGISASIAALRALQTSRSECCPTRSAIRLRRWWS